MLYFEWIRTSNYSNFYSNCSWRRELLYSSDSSNLFKYLESNDFLRWFESQSYAGSNPIGGLELTFLTGGYYV